MAKEILTPEDLADPGKLAAETRSQTRYHQPSYSSYESPSEIGMEQTHRRAYDIDSGLFDAFRKRSIDPLHSQALVKRVRELALGDFPGYEAMIQRREATVDRLNQKDALNKTALQGIEVKEVPLDETA